MNLPTRGVDVGAKVEIYKLLEDLCEQGVGIIIISLEMPEVLGIADKILVMHKDTIVAEVAREEASQDETAPLRDGAAPLNGASDGLIYRGSMNED